MTETSSIKSKLFIFFLINKSQKKRKKTNLETAVVTHFYRHVQVEAAKYKWKVKLSEPQITSQIAKILHTWQYTKALGKHNS